MIRNVRKEDIAAIAAIYNRYIADTCITFETEPVSDEEMGRRIRSFTGKGYPCLVCEEGGRVARYCYAHAWKEKQAYSRTAETTVYLHPDCKGRGLGKELMKTLVDACRQSGLHVLIACITVPNEASVRLHESLGFRQVSRFNEVGQKFGRWLDVYDFQLTL